MKIISITLTIIRLVIEISEWRQDGELKERKEEVAKRTSSSSPTLIRAWVVIVSLSYCEKLFLYSNNPQWVNMHLVVSLSVRNLALKFCFGNRYSHVCWMRIYEDSRWCHPMAFLSKWFKSNFRLCKISEIQNTTPWKRPKCGWKPLKIRKI